MVWRTTHAHLRSKFEPVKNDRTGLSHQALRGSNGIVQFPQRCLDEKRIVVRRTDCDAGFGDQAAGQPQHLGTVGLHREVTNGAWIGVGIDGELPAEYRRLPGAEEGIGLDRVQP